MNHYTTTVLQSWAIQTSFLGDAVLSLPYLYRYLETGGELVLLAAPRNEAIFKRAQENGLSPWADKLHVISWDKKKSRNPYDIYRISKENRAAFFTPQHTYCLQRSFSSALMAYFSGADKRIGFSVGAAPFLYTHCASREWESGRHEIEKNLDLLRVVHPTQAWSQKAPSLLGSARPQKQVVALSLASPWATKEWPLENAQALITRLVSEGVEVHLLGDKSFESRAAQLEKNTESKLLKNFTAKTSINEWIQLIGEAAVLVSGDSAAVHVACDLGVPVVAIFGPTVTEFGFAPWRKNARVLSLDLECRPCDIHGPKKCPLSHHKCMKEIKASIVYGAIQEFLV